MKKKILILAANPKDTNKLRLDEEVREIQAAHRKARNREEIEITSEWAIRVDDLRSALLYHKPNIVHFCGHGMGDDGLILENQYGQKQLVSSDSLAGLFKLFENDIECVVMNACYSEVQAEVIHQHINCVVGMNQAIGDKAAIEFATGFYDGLTNGRNYQDSFEFGKNALDLESIPELQTPQIKIKDNSQSLVDSTSTDNKPPLESDFEPIKNIPNRGAKNFVGRQDELVEIHTKLQENNTLAISAVSGMGGVGKTELAIQYAQRYDNYYPGGICWLNARSTSLAAEIIQFTQLQMGLEIPRKDFQGNLLSLTQQVSWCWQNWQPAEGLVLLVFDDLISLEGFRELLPAFKRFRILLTTRLRDMEANIEAIRLDILSEEKALDLFTKLLGKNGERKVVKELETAQEICKWLGYLPLGIELVGRYIKKKPPHFTLKKMLQQLKQQRLDSKAINNPQQQTLSTAQRGVLDAFEISWLELSPPTREVGALLSLFAGNLFDWGWVESMSKSLNWDESDVEVAIEQLYQRHLVQCLEEDDEEGVYYYQIHPLIREFLKVKLQASAQIQEFKQAFASTFIEIAKTIFETATLKNINSVEKAIPHLTEVLENHLDVVKDENLYSAFLVNGRFYQAKGLYTLAEPWYEKSVSIVRERLGENHPDTASCLNDLGFLYKRMGRYEEAKTLHIQALELRKQLLGVNHTDVAQSLNDLASIYHDQGKYDKAEPLYIQALELRKQLLGVNHSATAISLCHLAALYHDQGKYDKAESLYIQSLELRKQLLGENHPHVAISLNNLAKLYENEGKYDKAEPLYIQALELRKQLLGVNHPMTAVSLGNLASLYHSQEKYGKAEPLYIQALELRKQLLGENHPHTTSNLNNLAMLYFDQENYDKAEPLFIQALELRKQLLGENHPRTATSLNNLAKLYSRQGRYDEAEPLFIKALQLRKQLLTENHPHTANSLNNLAKLYSRQRRYDEAEPLFIQAVEIAERVLGESHPNTVKYRGDLEDFRKKQREGGSSEQ